MSPTLDQVTQDSQFVLMKGEPGTRKSTCALSYPTPQYWFSHDKKMDALILPMRNWGINPKLITFDDYSDWDKSLKKLKEFELNCEYKTIIVDSITSTGDSINRQTLKSKTGTTTKGGGEAGDTVGGIAVNTMRDYKAEAAAFNELVARLKDISSFHKVNVILIAHVIGQRKPEDAVASTHFSRIIVTGGQIISAKIPAYCSEVYHFNIEQEFDVEKEGKYGLLTVHTGADFARTSLPLPRKITFGSEPLYDKYIKPAIEKNKKEAPPLVKF